MQLLAQTSPAGLALAVDHRRVEDGAAPQFLYPPHIERIDREVIDAIARGQQRRQLGGDDRPQILIVALPPRHGKSTEISEHAPAWFLGTFPERRVILCSYQADFAADWGLKARTLLEEHGRDLYNVEVDPGSRSAKRWKLKGHRGGMVTAGVGGPITGMGADLLVIDDPVKNAEEAMSEVIREKHWDWWLSTARTRLQPGGVVVLLMTRWHQDDLAGRMIKAWDDGDGDGDPVHELRLPALAEKNDPLGRKPGEALWPEMYTAAYHRHTRKQSAYWFSAMYQGSPTPDEGGIFNRKHFRYFAIEGDQAVLRLPGGDTQTWAISECRKVTYLDLAASEKQTADYTVLTEAWITPTRQLLIRRVTRDRIPGPDQPDFVKAHMVGVVKPESIGYQTTLIQSLIRAGVAVEPVYPDKDKVTRASAAGALYRGGQVYHLAGAEWLGDFELELLAFPAGEHDDQVDTVAYAAKDLPDMQIAQRPRKRRAQKTVTGGLLRRDL